MAAGGLPPRPLSPLKTSRAPDQGRPPPSADRFGWRRAYNLSSRQPVAGSSEQEVGRMDRGAVHERDGLVVGVQAGVDRPLVGRTDLGECGPLRGRAEADETQRCRRAGTVAREVEDGVAVGLPGRNTNVSLPALPTSTSAPAPPLSVLLPALPWRVLLRRVAGAGQVADPLQHQRFHIRRQRVVDRGKYRIGALVEVLENDVADIVDEVGVVAGSPDTCDRHRPRR